LPKFKQFEAVRAAAPEVVIARSVTHVAVLAAPSERVKALSVLLLSIEIGELTDAPVSARAPVIVYVVPLPQVM